MKVIIPCEECLVRPVCRKPGEIIVRCLNLFNSIVLNEEGNIVQKLKRVDEIFHIGPGIEEKGRLRSPNNTLLIFGKGVNRCLTYYNDYRLLDIENPFKPNIRHLKDLHGNRWLRIFKPEWETVWK